MRHSWPILVGFVAYCVLGFITIFLVFGTQPGWSIFYEFSGRVFPPAESDAQGCTQIAATALILFSPAVIVAMFVAGRLQVDRRLHRDRCVRCEYDLTGNVSGRCPECGKLLSSTMNESGA